MEDERIIALLWERSELALCELERKYGKLCRQLAHNILNDPQDTEECISDAFLSVWNTVPPARPEYLKAFLCRIVKNHALNRLRHDKAQKRGSGDTLPLTELDSELSGGNMTEETVDAALLGRAINRYLHGLPVEKRSVFIMRYWYSASIEQISNSTGWSQSKVKSVLFRMRSELRTRLEKEGFML
ncbi:MAG: sigma-70 family RNA polymerase sigma factor [Butyricicoccus sp.]|nr:sigma-70 family RNA polymerase sigma factor [Butyricicoccus sp.]